MKLRPNTSTRSKRNALFFVVLAIIGWVVWTVVRSRFLLARGREIAQHSAAFKREYSIGKTGAPTLTYLALGDSTAAGWGAKELSETYVYQVATAIAARGFRVRVANVAVGGAKLNDLLQHQIAAINRVRPDIITIGIGANDATHFTPMDEYSANWRRLISRLGKSGAKQILISNTPDMLQAPALPLPFAVLANRRARQQNEALKTALRTSSIQTVDLHNRGKLIYKRDKNLYARDLFHPSAKGYAIWAQLFMEKALL